MANISEQSELLRQMRDSPDKEAGEPTQWDIAWREGCRAEARARDEGLSAAAQDLRTYVEVTARRRRDASAEKLAVLAFSVYTAGMPWWRRVRYALRGTR